MYFFLIFTQKFKISHRFRDKSVFAFYTEIQDGRQKWRESNIFEMSPVHSADTLGVKNFIKIALYLTVSTINALLRFTQKFKMEEKRFLRKVTSKYAYTL